MRGGSSCECGEPLTVASGDCAPTVQGEKHLWAEDALSAEFTLEKFSLGLVSSPRCDCAIAATAAPHLRMGERSPAKVTDLVTRELGFERTAPSRPCLSYASGYRGGNEAGGTFCVLRELGGASVPCLL